VICAIRGNKVWVIYNKKSMFLGKNMHILHHTLMAQQSIP